jgi:hypothetical protein
MSEQSEAVKKALAEGKEARAKMLADAEARQQGKPTPTQEENDRAKLGEHVMEKEDDGSGPEPKFDVRGRQVEAAKPSSGYQTRQQTRPSTASSSS